MSIVIAILILFGVIVFHELGHFLVAKACHIKVNEFAIGLGPKIVSVQKGETLYSWRLIPIGGMCAMQGEDEDDLSEGSFQSAKVWKRILVVAAGPLFNFLMAFIASLIVILCAGADPCTVVSVTPGSPAEEAGLQEGDLIVSYEGSGISNARELYLDTAMDGLPKDGVIDIEVNRNGENIGLSFALAETESYVFGFNYSTAGEKAVITSVNPGSPAEKAGIEAEDVITAVNGHAINTPEDLQSYFNSEPPDGSAVSIEYERDGIKYTAEVVPEATVSQSGGFSYNMAREKTDLPSSIRYAFGEVKYWIKATIKSLAGLFNGTYGVNDLSGPVGVVSAVGDVYEQAASDGTFAVVMSMLNMLILISANIGIVNLLPLPALDGGRLIFLFIECIRRKRCSQTIESMVHFIGFAAIMCFAVFVAFNDVLKLF